MSDREKKIALISVSDKTNIEKIAKSLVNLNYLIISTGGTAKYLQKHGVKIITVSDFTNFEEILDGRVKTLHPRIHAGILARKANDLDKLNDNYKLIDIVIVNLYPFLKTIADPKCTFDNAVENIDIGGPAMLRAAAKNHYRVTTLVDPDDYVTVLEQIQKSGKTTLELRKKLAAKVYDHTSEYDRVITSYLNDDSKNKTVLGDPFTSIDLEKDSTLRYGENPHQDAVLYKISSPNFDNFNFSKLSGKALSYNNLVDTDCAHSCVQQFSKPACVIVKHANPCGVSESSSIELAYQRSFKCDPISSFGGIIAINRRLTTRLLTKILNKQFVEVIVAPSTDKACLDVLKKKPNVRLLVIKNTKKRVKSYEIKSLKNKLLIQTSDNKEITKKDLKVVTKKKPSQTQTEDLIFAFKVVRYVKSNAIVFVKNKTTLGIGAGQMSRIDSTKIAKEKAKNFNINLKGSIMASEAFFPFPDNVDLAHKTGVTSIIQPGGSLRDKVIIEVADKHKISMVFSGTRVFKH
tara:strand:- start:29 stop:1585 length:1557 start_codon:yes stop_codon:yes gene_type:complete